MVGDVFFEVEIKYCVNFCCCVIIGVCGYWVGGGCVDCIVIFGQVVLFEWFLVGKGELCVSWWVGYFVVLVGYKKVMCVVM